MTEEDYNDDGRRIPVGEIGIYDRAAALEGGLIIVHDKGDGNFEELPSEQIMLDAIGIDMETRQKYAQYSDQIHADRHRLWLDELEADYQADS